MVSPPPYPVQEQTDSQFPSSQQGHNQTILDPSASLPEKYKLPAILYVATERRCTRVRSSTDCKLDIFKAAPAPLLLGLWKSSTSAS